MSETNAGKPTQREFLLAWLMSRPRQRFSPNTLAEIVTSDYKRSFGKPFKDVGKAARELAHMGRIQRTTKGLNQNYWYDPDTDSASPIVGTKKSLSATEAVWYGCLRAEVGVNQNGWEALGRRIDSDLSPAEANKLLTQFARLLAKSSIKPPN